MQFLKLSTDLITDENLTANELRIYMYLLSLYNEAKKCSYPSMEVIAEKTHISLSTVKRSIAKLIELGYITVEKRKGLAGNFNIYKELKHLIGDKISNKKAENKEGNQNIGEESKAENEAVKPLVVSDCKESGLQITIDEVKVKEEQQVEVNKIDNHTNVRLARTVTDIDKSNFAKKILTLADEGLLREAIKTFKKKKGRNATFLIQMLVDQYYKHSIKFSIGMLNLLRKGLKFQNINQVEVCY